MYGSKSTISISIHILEVVNVSQNVKVWCDVAKDSTGGHWGACGCWFCWVGGQDRKLLGHSAGYWIYIYIHIYYIVCMMFGFSFRQFLSLMTKVSLYWKNVFFFSG